MEIEKKPYINKAVTDLWLTPKKFYIELNKEFNFNFDPCPYPKPKWDGLKVDWKEKNYVNPPYSQLKQWIEKSFREWRKGKTVVLLMPPRTDTIAFHKYINGYAEIRFIKGRLKFNDGEIAAPFPNILVIWKGEKW